jgi:dihydroorotate dehydrogenase
MGLIWEKLLRPAMFALDAEHAHELGIKALRYGLASPFYVKEAESGLGPAERFGLKFRNPIGLAAGFDKNGLVFEEIASLGFGFVEVGTVTLRPQPGNEKPRLFRLPRDRALINRLGSNNDGALAVAERVQKRRSNCVLGINIGKNKDVRNEEAIDNYLACFEIMHPFADYIAVNVSSPNTPDLRDLQKAENLKELLGALQVRNRELGAKPILVKIAPDLSESEVESVADIALNLGISGIIATNTTIARNGLETNDVELFGGGLSGRPLANRSNEVISMIYRYSKGKLPIIGVGGIFTAEDAFAKICAGACLLQIYTGFVYGGPTFARDLGMELADLLRAKGFTTIDQAIGSASA